MRGRNHRRAWLRGGLLLAGLLALVAIAMPTTRYMLELAFAPRPTHLAVPVQGVAPAGLADTWGAARSGGRRHEGIDHARTSTKQRFQSRPRSRRDR